MARMAYVSLYRKYRPQTFSEILGQEHVSSTLANAITEDRVAHAYLFTGPRGTGKTSTARILAKALNCEQGPTPNPCGKCESCIAIAQGSSMDVFEMDAASHSGVDETREILSGVPLATAGGRKKVYVIDEVHMLTTQSFNALLKTLEEPPDHVIFVLATTEAHKVLPTIVSRTQRFDFRRMPLASLVELLSDVAKRESIDIDPDAIEVVARHAEGGARDALSALDQLRSVGGNITVEHAERLLGERGEDAFIQLFDGIANADIGSVFTTLDSMISQGADVRQLALGTLAHARGLMLLKTAPQAEDLLDVHAEDRQRLADQAGRFRIGGLLRLLELVGKAITEMRNAPNHRLFLEVALTRSASPETDLTPEGFIGRIERLERRIGLEEGSAPSPSTQPERSPDPKPEPVPVQEVAATPETQVDGVSSRGCPRNRTGNGSRRSRTARGELGGSPWARSHQGRVAIRDEGGRSTQQACCGIPQAITACRLRFRRLGRRGAVRVPRGADGHGSQLAHPGRRALRRPRAQAVLALCGAGGRAARQRGGGAIKWRCIGRVRVRGRKLLRGCSGSR